MAYLLIRALYLVYFGGAAIILLISMSRLAFGEIKSNELPPIVLLAVIWPLSLFSKSGRSALRTALKTR